MALQVTWQDTDGCTVPVSLRARQDGDECGIFQLPVDDVRIEGLPAAWTDAGRMYDVAELRCAHRFHACALALHFATNDMRCPVCRQGSTASLAVESVSLAMQSPLLAKVGELHTREARDEQDVSLELDIDEVLKDLTLQVEIRWINLDCVSTHTYLSTPLRLDEDAGLEARQPYTTHRSFQRLFNSNFRRAQVHDAEFRFSLQHPLLPYTVRSPLLQGPAMADLDIVLANGVAALAITHSQHRPAVLDLRINTQFLLMMCVQHVMHHYEHLIAR
jgi:hypothetical protein